MCSSYCLHSAATSMSLSMFYRQQRLSTIHRSQAASTDMQCEGLLISTYLNASTQICPAHLPCSLRCSCLHLLAPLHHLQQFWPGGFTRGQRPQQRHTRRIIAARKHAKRDSTYPLVVLICTETLREHASGLRCAECRCAGQELESAQTSFTHHLIPL
jgi:hypothetical protein